VATAPARHPVGAITALVGAAVIVLLVVQLDDLVALFASRDTPDP
jgi:ABC-type Fe3+-siderophore transport system permease subunit